MTEERDEIKERAARKAAREAELAADTKLKKSSIFSVDPAIATRVEAEAGKALKAWASKHGHMGRLPPEIQQQAPRQGRREQVIRLLQQRGTMTATEIMTVLKVHRSQVSEITRPMLRDGAIEASKNRLTITYRLVEKSA